MRHQSTVNRWAILWHSVSRLDGTTVYFIRNKGEFALFRTRREAREWNKREHGYIKDRPDLRAEPHGWNMPKVVPVTVTIAFHQ